MALILKATPAHGKPKKSDGCPPFWGQSPCGSELARDSGGSVCIEVTGSPHREQARSHRGLRLPGNSVLAQPMGNRGMGGLQAAGQLACGGVVGLSLIHI